MSNKTLVNNSQISNKTSADVLRSSINFQAGEINFTGAVSEKCVLSGIKDAVASDQAVTKSQLDSAVGSVSSGLSWKDSVRAATTANLSVTYDASAGTLTGSAELGDVDGVTLNDNDRIIVKNQTDKKQNGMYVVTRKASPFLLTRSEDADTVGELSSAVAVVMGGTENGGIVYLQKNELVAFNTSDVEFARISSAIDVFDTTDGLIRQGKTVKLNTGSTTTIISDKIEVADGAISTQQLANGCVGNNQLQADAVDTTNIIDLAVSNEKLLGQIAGDKLQDSAITTAKVGDRQITSSKLGLRAVTSAEIAQEAVQKDNILAGTIDESLIEGKSLTGNSIADGSLTTSLYANNSVGTDALQALCVGSAELKGNAVTTNKILAGNVTNAKLSRVNGDEAVSADTIRDGACERRTLPASVIDETRLDTGCVTNLKIADNAINSRTLGTLSSIEVAGEGRFGSLVVGGSGGSGTPFSLAKCIFNSIEFTGDWDVPASWSRIADNDVSFNFEDAVVAVSSNARCEVETNGFQSQLAVILAVQYYKDDGTLKPFLEPVTHEYRTTAQSTRPQEINLQGFIANTSGGEQRIARVRWYMRELTSHAQAKIPSGTDLIAVHMVVNSTSSRQDQTYDGNNLIDN